MSDKIKEFRDNNAILDIAAGFIPGVGEVQDAHDFYHAFTKKDLGGMALASLGLVVPGLTGGQITKGAKVLKKLLNKSDNVVSPTRKYAKALEAPIYTRETAPKSLQLTDKDITEMHYNDGSLNASKLSDKEMIDKVMKDFAEADHGTAVRIGDSLKEAGDGLSSASAPIYFKMTRRWHNHGKGGYFIPEGEPELVPLNKVAQSVPNSKGQVHPRFSQETVDKLNKEIEEINKLGYNFPKARLTYAKNPWIPEKNPKEYMEYERTKKPIKILIPNIGFLKYGTGGIFKNIRKNFK